MQAFGSDSQPLGSSVTSVTDPLGSSISFAAPLSHERQGDGWNTWSNGYTGDVYATGGAQSATITLPAGTDAFYFYAEPDPYATYDFTATAQDGTSSGSLPIYGEAGAAYLGFYTTGATPLISITVSSSIDFAIGEFGIALIPSATSNNWAGYVSQYPPNQPVSASLTVPTVTCNVAGRIAMWVGYDGWESNSNTVEQDGISAVCPRAGARASFVAWYELFKCTLRISANHCLNLNPFSNVSEIDVNPGASITPGDKVSLFVDRISPGRFGRIPLGRDQILFSIYVNSSSGRTLGHWSQSITEPVAFSPKYDSSECITERNVPRPLPKFTPIGFASCSVITDAASPSDLLRIDLIGTAGKIATAGYFNSNDDFSVTWLGSS